MKLNMFLTHLLTHASFQVLTCNEQRYQREYFSIIGTEVKHCANIQEQTEDLGFNPNNLH